MVTMGSTLFTFLCMTAAQFVKRATASAHLFESTPADRQQAISAASGSEHGPLPPILARCSEDPPDDAREDGDIRKYLSRCGGSSLFR